MMEAILRLYALLMIPASLAFIAGSVIYVARPEQPLLAATLGPLIGVTIVGVGIVFGLDTWILTFLRRHWPGS